MLPDAAELNGCFRNGTFTGQRKLARKYCSADLVNAKNNRTGLFIQNPLHTMYVIVRNLIEAILVTRMSLCIKW